MSSPRRILIADDEPMIREALTELLERAGFEVVGAVADGAEAVRVSSERRPDIVLIDVQMPAMDGIEATRRILQDRPETRVIVLSASVDPGLAAAIRDAGAVDHIAKGTPPHELIRRIASAGTA